MSQEFTFPDVGEGITEGEIVKWLISVGDTVTEDQNIVKIETDKAVVDIPSPFSGKVISINFKEGESVKVGEVLLVVDNGQEKKSSVKPKSKPISETGHSVVGQLEEAPEEESSKPLEVDCEGGICKDPGLAAIYAEVQGKKSSGKILAMPGVKKLAKEKGVDLSKVHGTGKNGRILENDLHFSLSAPDPKTHGKTKVFVPSSGVQVQKKYDMYGYIEREPLKGLRKAIAKNMSIQAAIPMVTHMEEIDASALYKLRKKEKGKIADVKLTYLPFIVKAVCLALKNHPLLNSSLEEETIILKKYFNIGIAVATKDGLMVPVLKGADKKSIIDIAKEITILADKAKDRTIDLMEMKGGTFTITNVGSLGGTYATPILNMGESAILALGRIMERPVIIGKKVKRLGSKQILPISLTFDHRILDGAHAALFVNSVKQYLEDPEFLLLGIA
jgi:pyruvate dehydrogenase E2 component (dihydrolipoamide acetyltransferase)